MKAVLLAAGLLLLSGLFALAFPDFPPVQWANDLLRPHIHKPWVRTLASVGGIVIGAFVYLAYTERKEHRRTTDDDSRGREVGRY